MSYWSFGQNLWTEKTLKRYHPLCQLVQEFLERSSTFCLLPLLFLKSITRQRQHKRTNFTHRNFLTCPVIYVGFKCAMQDKESDIRMLISESSDQTHLTQKERIQWTHWQCMPVCLYPHGMETHICPHKYMHNIYTYPHECSHINSQAHACRHRCIYVYFSQKYLSQMKNHTIVWRGSDSVTFKKILPCSYLPLS